MYVYREAGAGSERRGIVNAKDARARSLKAGLSRHICAISIKCGSPGTSAQYLPRYQSRQSERKFRLRVRVGDISEIK